MMQKDVGILLFHEVEVLDFAGPFEVFSIAENGENREKAFRVHTVAQSKDLIRARNGLKIQPDYFRRYFSRDQYVILYHKKIVGRRNRQCCCKTNGI